jgi:non-specific serine/threonine protein kinase
MHQTYAARTRAAYKIGGLIPDMPDGFVEHAQYPPNAYQRVAIATTVGYDASALYAQQGTGKTPMALFRIMTEAKMLRDREPGSCYRVLVVAPKNVRLNWASEVRKFSTIPGKVTVLRGGQLERGKLLCRAMQDEPDHDALFTIVITSYETAKNSWDYISMVEWDLVAADESHNFKNPSSKRYKTMCGLREISKRRTELTGTPITNSVMDLFTQLEFLGEGMSGFIDFKAFRKFYGKFERDEITGRDKFLGFQNMPFLQERLQRLAFMITKKEALPDLPEKTYDIVEVGLTEMQLEIYKELQSQLAVEIKGKIDDAERAGENPTVTINCVLTMLLRLAQITSGFVVTDAKVNPDDGTVLDAKKAQSFSPCLRLDQLVADLKAEDPHTKTIVWAVWVTNIKAISERLTIEGIKHVTFYGATSDDDREDAVQAFNKDDSVRVFIGNPAACREGLNLLGYDTTSPIPGSMNVDHVIRYSSNWSMVQRAQSEDRCHRIGTRRNVRYTDYVCADTIDQEILTRVQNHIKTAESIQDVRQIMARVLEMVPEADEGVLE